MEGDYRIAAEVALPDLRVERVTQDGSGPFRRTHHLQQPSLVYLPPFPGSPARGCFGAAKPDRRLMRFGAAVVVPADTPLHVLSPGFARRQMFVARFDEHRFARLTGIDGRSGEAELMACADVRAPAVLDVMRRLAGEMERPALASETMIAGLGLLLLGELARHFERLRDRRTGLLAGWQIQRIEERLAAEDRPAPDVDELATLCGIGRRHLMRAFKATAGVTVMERVEQCAFDRAARLLGQGASVKRVAATLGYEHQGSFSTAFKRRFGLSPSDFRARST